MPHVPHVSRPSTSQRFSRPRVEVLEDRLAPATRLVVPAGTENNTTSFATLQAALSTAGLGDGDVIQIEAGAAPGDVASNPTTVDNLTILANAALAESDIPEFTVSGDFVIATGQTGFTFQHARIRTTGLAGEISAQESLAIIDCFVTADGSDPDPIVLAGPRNFVADSEFTANNINITSLLTIEPADSGRNQITSNHFFAQALQGSLLTMQTATVVFAQGDFASNNWFEGAGASNYTMLRVNGTSGMYVNTSFNYNLFQDFSGASTPTAISVEGGVRTFLLQGNRIELNGPGAQGIVLKGATSGSDEQFGQLDANTITTPGGPAIRVVNGTAPQDLNIQNNVPYNSKIGIFLDFLGSTGDISKIDLGSGFAFAGSNGGNDFRTFTAAATATSGALVVSGTRSGTIEAQKNIFANGVDATTQVFSLVTSLNIIGVLTANEQYINNLYTHVLHHGAELGNTSMDAGLWVRKLDSGTPRTQVVTSIVRSGEAISQIITAMYLQFLGRNSDTGAATIGNQFNAGGTLEQGMVLVLGSAEFRAQAGSDVNFIRRLYDGVLGRDASSAEVDAWLGVLATQGAGAVVNGIVFSREFRTLGISRMYGGEPQSGIASVLPPYLHRQPSAAEVNSWADSGLDLLSISVQFAASQEFYVYG